MNSTSPSPAPGPLARFTRSLLALAALAGIAASPAPALAGTIVPEWQPPVHANTNPGTPNGTATVTGDSLMMKIAGGGVGNSNYMRLFSNPMQDLPFPKPGEAVKLSVSGISFVPVPGSAPGADQILYFTLTPTPNAVPYKDGATGIQQGISLSITAAGVYSLGWVVSSGGEKGWLPAFNNSGRTGTAPDTITGFDLILTNTGYTLVLTTTGDSIELLGQHNITEPWGDLGINVTLKKMFAGGTEGNTLTVNIDSLQITTIPEPTGVALAGAGLALVFVAHSRRVRAAQRRS